MTLEYIMGVEPNALIFTIGLNWYRLAGDIWGPDLRTNAPAVAPRIRGTCAIRENGGQKQYAFTHARGSFHLLVEGTNAWATAGVDGSSPKTSGTLEGQTGETAEARLRAYLFQES